MLLTTIFFFFFFFNDTATTEIYTLSLHDALPICGISPAAVDCIIVATMTPDRLCPSTAADRMSSVVDRKSTRLNSSHGYISYAVFCLKKKKKKEEPLQHNSYKQRYSTHVTYSSRY